MKTIITLLLLFTNVALATYFPKTSLLQSNLDLSVTNPLPTRLTDGTSYLLGQKTMAGSIPFTIASDQSGLKLKGATDGTEIANIGGKLRVSNKPYLMDIAEFEIPGHTPIYLTGYATGINATRVDIWENVPAGNYVFPTAPIQMDIVSTSASDSAAGTGIRTVDVMYLDDTYTEQVTTVTLNGTTPVNTTPTNILRVNGFHALTAGSTGAAVGNISLRSVGGGTVYSRILATNNLARNAIFTVPAGKRMGVSGYQVSTTTAAAGHAQTISIRATSSPDNQVTPGVFMFKTLTILDNTSSSMQFGLPIILPAQTDLKVSAFSDGANSAIVAITIEGWIE